MRRLLLYSNRQFLIYFVLLAVDETATKTAFTFETAELQRDNKLYYPFRDQRDIYVPLTKSLFKSAGITVSRFFSMLPSILKYLYSVEPVRMHFPAKLAHSIICTRLFCGKMHPDWFNGIEILQGSWQHGEKMGYCYPRGLEKTLCKWDVYVPLVTRGLSVTSL